MAVWERYPAHYRAREVERIIKAARSGESSAVLGLSGSGKSNLVGFLASGRNTAATEIDLVMIDCNRIHGDPAGEFCKLALTALSSSATFKSSPTFEMVSASAAQRIHENEKNLCLLLDRFETLMTDGLLLSNLRALRDENKYSLTYVITSRQPLLHHNELAELFFGNTFWLGPLSEEDTRWSASDYAQRAGIAWTGEQVSMILDLSGRYPSFLRAVCQAASAGVPLEISELINHPAVRARLDEFWADQPDEHILQLSGLQDNPLLAASRKNSGVAADLTAKEKRLFDLLQSDPGRVFEKDELISAVWPEDQIFERGLRDDSLAQLVRRLREKIEADPSHPRHILTIPGRGYRYLS